MRVVFQTTSPGNRDDRSRPGAKGYRLKAPDRSHVPSPAPSQTRRARRRLRALRRPGRRRPRDCPRRPRAQLRHLTTCRAAKARDRNGARARAAPGVLGRWPRRSKRPEGERRVRVHIGGCARNAERRRRSQIQRCCSRQASHRRAAAALASDSVRRRRRSRYRYPRGRPSPSRRRSMPLRGFCWCRAWAGSPCAAPSRLSRRAASASIARPRERRGRGGRPQRDAIFAVVAPRCLFTHAAASLHKPAPSSWSMVIANAVCVPQLAKRDETVALHHQSTRRGFFAVSRSV